MTDKWHRVSPRFSWGHAFPGSLPDSEGFIGLGITYYWTPKRRHHKVFIHLVFLRIVLAWHRRQPAKVYTPPKEIGNLLG